MLFRSSFFALLMLLALSVCAEAEKSIVLQHVIADPLQIKYKEIRQIQFIEEPILSSGTIYISKKNFVLEQIEPQQVLVASDHKRLWLNDLVSGKKYTKHIGRLQRKDPALSALITSLRFGDTEKLQRQFAVVETKDKTRWQLTFEPKIIQSKKKYTSIVASGVLGALVDSLHINYKNGNQDEWLFKYESYTTEPLDVINKLVHDAGGL